MTAPADRAEPPPRPAAATVVARTRARVHQAVLAVLHEEGLDAVTHLRVAQRGEVGRATLYRHWPTREELILDALANTEGPGEPPLTGDLRTDLVTHVEAVRRALFDEGYGSVVSSLIGRADWESSAAELLVGLYEKVARWLRSDLAAGEARGRVRPGVDHDAVITQLLGPVVLGRFVVRRAVTAAEVAALVDEVLDAVAP